MKNDLELREYTHLVIDPQGDQKKMKRLSGARIFIKDGYSHRLKPFSSLQQDALIDVSLITSERDQSFPEELIRTIEARIQLMESPLGIEFLDLIKNGRLHVLFILNSKYGANNALESYVKLIKHIEKNGGFASAIGVEHLEADVAKLFMETKNRYVTNDTQLRFNLSGKVSNPKVIYQKGSDYMFLSIQRAHEIGWLRAKLLEAINPAFYTALKQRIDNIPLPLPNPSDPPDDYPIAFTAQETSESALAQPLEDPIAFVSRLLDIPAEELPQDVREALISNSQST